MDEFTVAGEMRNNIEYGLFVHTHGNLGRKTEGETRKGKGGVGEAADDLDE